MKRLTSLILVLALLSPVAHAAINTSFQKLLDQEIQDTSIALNSAGTNTEVAAWTLTNLYLKLQAMVGFKIPFIATLTVVPQMELVWHRNLKN